MTFPLFSINWFPKIPTVAATQECSIRRRLGSLTVMLFIRRLLAVYNSMLHETKLLPLKCVQVSVNNAVQRDSACAKSGLIVPICCLWDLTNRVVLSISSPYSHSHKENTTDHFIPATFISCSERVEYFHKCSRTFIELNEFSKFRTSVIEALWRSSLLPVSSSH